LGHSERRRSSGRAALSTCDHGKAYIMTMVAIPIRQPLGQDPLPRPPRVRIGANGPRRGCNRRLSHFRSSLPVMPFPHPPTRPVRTICHPHPVLPRAPFEIEAELFRIFLEAPHQILLLSHGVALTSDRNTALSFRSLSWQARWRRIRRGLRASVSTNRGIEGAWGGGPAVACRSQRCSGSTRRTCSLASRLPRLCASAPSAASAHPGHYTFPCYAAESITGPSVDAGLRRR